MATLAIRGSGVEVGARHDGLCDPLSTDTTEAYAVWVIVDRLTKLTHFLAVRMIFTLEEFYRLYIREIVQLHGVAVSIVSDRVPGLRHTFGRVSKRLWGHS